MTGSTPPRLLTLSERVSTQSARTVEFMGRPFRVIPAVLVQSQVLVNNLGRMFLPAEYITDEWAHLWNGVPVIVGPHPSINGEAVSGRTPAILDARGVGFIFNAFADTTANGVRRLRGEVWIDTARAEAVEELGRIFERLDEGGIVELSTGFQTTVENTGGMFNGEQYDQVLIPQTTDHLIITADLTGACSVAHGCGLGVQNVESSTEETMERGIHDAPEFEILTDARRPIFAGVEDTAWTIPTFDDFRFSLGLISAHRPTDLSLGECVSIANHALLGNPNARTVEEMSYATVVNPHTGRINTRALREVMQGRGGLDDARVSSAARESAIAQARLLLDEVTSPPSAFARAIQSGAQHAMSLFNRKADKAEPKAAAQTAWQKAVTQNLARFQSAFQSVPETDQQHAAMLQDALQDKFGGAERHVCVSDVYSSTAPRQVIFFLMTPNGAVPAGMEYFRCDYEETSTGVFTFTEPVRVLRMVSYEPLQQDSLSTAGQPATADNTTSTEGRPCGCHGAQHTPPEDDAMTNEEKASLVSEVAQAVAGQFTALVEGLKSEINAVKTAATNSAKEAVEAVVNPLKEQVASLSTAVNAERDSERQNLVAFLSKDQRTAFTQAELEAMTLNQLQKLHETIAPEATYFGGRGGPRAVNTEPEAEFAPPVPYFVKPAAEGADKK